MKTKIFRYGFHIILLVLLLACSDSEQSDEVVPSPEPPTEQFIVNMTVSDVGEETGIYGCNKLPWGNDALYREDHGLADEAFFSILGNNYNTDGSYPTNFGDDFARPGGTNIRNNTGITFVLADDTSANAELIVHKTFEWESRGIVSGSCGDPSIEIIQFDFTFRELQPNSEVLGPYPEISYYQEEFINISSGNFFINIDGTDTDMNRFVDFASQTQNPIKIKILETIIVVGEERTIYKPEP